MLKRIALLFLAYFILMPIYAGTSGMVLWFAINDTYETSMTHNILTSLPDRDDTTRSVWTDNVIMLRTGDLTTAGSPIDPATKKRYPGCAVVRLTVEQQNTKRQSEWNERDTQVLIGKNPKIDKWLLDPTFLQSRFLEGEAVKLTAEEYGYPMANCTGRCIMTITCIPAQPMSVLALIQPDENGENVLTYPPLPEKEYPLLQHGLQNPASFGEKFNALMRPLGWERTSTLLLIGIVSGAIMLWRITESRKIFDYMLLLPLLGIGASYYVIGSPLAASLLLVAAAASMPAFLRAALGGLHKGIKLPQNELLKASQKAIYTPGPLVGGAFKTAPSTPAAAVSVDKVVANMLATLSPLTISALSDTQLENAARNHLDRREGDLYDRLSHDEQNKLVTKVAQLLRARAVSVKR